MICYLIIPIYTYIIVIHIKILKVVKYFNMYYNYVCIYLGMQNYLVCLTNTYLSRRN